jgi:hypothetical protein
LQKRRIFFILCVKPGGTSGNPPQQLVKPYQPLAIDGSDEVMECDQRSMRFVRHEIWF